MNRIMACEGSDCERLISEAVRKIDNPNLKWDSIRKN